MAGASRRKWSQISSSASIASSGSTPVSMLSNCRRTPGSSAANRACQTRRAAAPRCPAVRHAARMRSGTTKGGSDQPRRWRAAATSSAPSGAPCVSLLPCLLGAPNPITVRQAISDGRSARRAAPIASATASGSWPSTRATDQPDAAKRNNWSSEHDSDVAPSIEMPLSSNSTISRASRRWPASEIASWLMPSIRQPSPAIT
jgi:hypothetical protein